MSADSTAETRGRSIPWSSILIAAAISIVVSMILNQIVRLIGTSVADVPDGFEPLASAGPVVFASVMYGVFATISFIAVRFFANNWRRTWLIVGLVGLIVSFGPPLAQAGSDDSNGAAIAILMIMHVVAAAVFIPVFLRMTGE